MQITPAVLLPALVLRRDGGRPRAVAAHAAGEVIERFLVLVVGGERGIGRNRRFAGIAVLRQLLRSPLLGGVGVGDQDALIRRHLLQLGDGDVTPLDGDVVLPLGRSGVVGAVNDGVPVAIEVLLPLGAELGELLLPDQDMPRLGAGLHDVALRLPGGFGGLPGQ